MSRKNLKRLLTATAICGFVLWLLVQPISEEETLVTFWRRIYGGLMLTKDINIMNLAMFVMPIVAFPYAFSSYMSEEWRTRMPYVFTRTAQRSVWVCKKAAGLLGWAFAFQALHAGLLVAVSAIRGVALDFSSFTVHEAGMLLLNMLHIYTVSLLISLLSIKLDPVKVAVSVIAAHLCAIVLYNFVLRQYAPFAAYLLPACQFYYFWHTVPGLEGISAFAEPSFTILYSVIYIAVLLVVTMIAAVRAVKGMDII